MTETTDTTEKIDTWLSETQIFINKTIQDAISQIVDRIPEADPLTAAILFQQISEIYVENIKKNWKEMCDDRETYERVQAEELKELAEKLNEFS